MTHSKIVTISSEPGLAPVVATWLVETFFNYPGSYTVEEMTALILAQSESPKETFILFDGSQPVGTAAMIPADLDARPDLTPCSLGFSSNPPSVGVVTPRHSSTRSSRLRRAPPFRSCGSICLELKPFTPGLVG